MKKGILISGIVTIAVYAMCALIFMIVGITTLAGAAMAAADSGASTEEEVVIVAAVFISLTVYFVIAAIFAGVLIGKRNSDMGKGAGITLGVFGIVFGALVPGIFFIADSTQSRK